MWRSASPLISIQQAGEDRLGGPATRRNHFPESHGIPAAGLILTWGIIDKTNSNKPNIVIETTSRSSRRQEVDDPLDGGVGAVIGGFEPAVRTMLRVRPVMEAAVGERAAQALVEEEEEEGILDALGESRWRSASRRARSGHVP